MFLFIIIGLIFYFFGCALGLADLFYRKYAKVLQAKVISIEKFDTAIGTTEDHFSAKMYRTVIEANIDNQKILFSHIASNKMENKLNQTIPVLWLEPNKSHIKPKTNSLIQFAMILLLISSLSLGLALIYFKNIYLTIFCILIILFYCLFITYILRNRTKYKTIANFLLKNINEYKV